MDVHEACSLVCMGSKARQVGLAKLGSSVGQPGRAGVRKLAQQVGEQVSWAWDTLTVVRPSRAWQLSMPGAQQFNRIGSATWTGQAGWQGSSAMPSHEPGMHFGKSAGGRVALAQHDT